MQTFLKEPIIKYFRLAAHTISFATTHLQKHSLKATINILTDGYVYIPIILLMKIDQWCQWKCRSREPPQRYPKMTKTTRIKLIETGKYPKVYSNQGKRIKTPENRIGDLCGILTAINLYHSPAWWCPNRAAHIPGMDS